MKIEQGPQGEVILLSDNYYKSHMSISASEAFELLCLLDERRLELYQASQHASATPFLESDEPGEEERLHILMQQGMQRRLQSLADHIVQGDTTIYRGGHDE